MLGSKFCLLPFIPNLFPSPSPSSYLHSFLKSYATEGLVRPSRRANSATIDDSRLLCYNIQPSSSHSNDFPPPVRCRAAERSQLQVSSPPAPLIGIGQFSKVRSSSGFPITGQLRTIRQFVISRRFSQPVFFLSVN